MVSGGTTMDYDDTLEFDTVIYENKELREQMIQDEYRMGELERALADANDKIADLEFEVSKLHEEITDLENEDCSDCADLKVEVDDLDMLVDVLTAENGIYKDAVREILGGKFCDKVPAEYNIEELKKLIK